MYHAEDNGLRSLLRAEIVPEQTGNVPSQKIGKLPGIFHLVRRKYAQIVLPTVQHIRPEIVNVHSEQPKVFLGFRCEMKDRRRY